MRKIMLAGLCLALSASCAWAATTEELVRKVTGAGTSLAQGDAKSAAYQAVPWPSWNLRGTSLGVYGDAVNVRRPFFPSAQAAGLSAGAGYNAQLRPLSASASQNVSAG